MSHKSIFSYKNWTNERFYVKLIQYFRSLIGCGLHLGECGTSEELWYSVLDFDRSLGAIHLVTYIDNQSKYNLFSIIPTFNRNQYKYWMVWYFENKTNITLNYLMHWLLNLLILNNIEWNECHKINWIWNFVRLLYFRFVW